MSEVLVPAIRLPRWVENFGVRHGGSELTVVDWTLRGDGADGSWFVARLPFGASYDGLAVPADFADAVSAPGDWGVLLVRKGGFAVARLAGEQVVSSKVGQRHVQGRTKAGGQSQQRFARRRDNQARQAYEAAAGHAARILGDLNGPLITGGDRSAVKDVLEDQRLSALAADERWLPVADPRRAVLEAAIADALAVAIDVHNA